MANKEVNIRNKRARFEYHLFDIYTAGMQLCGTEIKSIRSSKASIIEAFCIFLNGEVWIRNMSITEYENGSFYNHKPKSDRKLLLNKKEINKIEFAPDPDLNVLTVNITYHILISGEIDNITVNFE